MIKSILKRLYQILIEPPSAYEVSVFHKSRLLSIFLLVMIVVFAGVDVTYVLTVPGYSVPWYGYIFLFTAVILNRLPYYHVSAWLVVFMFPAVIFSSVLSEDATVPAVSLGFLTAGLVLASILLSYRGVLIYSLANGMGIFLLPRLAPHLFPEISSIISPLAILAIVSALVMTSMRHRDQVEADRQALLRDNEEHIRLALKAARMGTWNWNIETSTVSWSDRIEAMFGMEPGQFDGKYETYLSLIHSDDLPNIQQAIERAFSDESYDYVVEHRLIWPNGEIRWLEGRGRVYRNVNGKPIRMAGTVVDIRERKRIEEQLRLSEERYRLVSSVISDYSFSKTRNEQGGFTLDWVTGAFEQITGYTSEEIKMRSGWIATVHPDDLAQDEKDTELLFQNQRVVSELRTIHKDGSVRWVRSYVHPRWDSEKNMLIGIYGAVQNITEQKRIEQEREDLILELEAKNAELEQFTYTVSHDLKAPIITIKGFLGYLSEDAASGNLQRLKADIRRISEAADKMHNLLNDLLELSRVGRMLNQSESVSFADLLKDAIELTDGHLQERSAQVVVAAALPVIYGDCQRLSEVVQNLLDNAAKFMGKQTEPEIEIGVRGSENGMSILYVRDNGIGIDPQYHERIFGLFNRLDQKVEGTGIGLALVKRIIELHGGRIWVESAEGQGATFYFTLPLAEK